MAWCPYFVALLPGLALLLGPIHVGPAHAEQKPLCSGPAVTDVISAALRQSGLHRRSAPNWPRRLAWSALLPRVSAGLSRSASWREYLNLSGVERPDQLDMNNDLALRWEVRATWDLSRLVFDSRELRVSARTSQLAAERRQLVQHVVKLYFSRCRLVASVAQHVERDPVVLQLRILRLTAMLDSLTGGLFAKELLQDD